MFLLPRQCALAVESQRLERVLSHPLLSSRSRRDHGGPRRHARHRLVEPDLLTERVPLEEFAELRSTAPVCWYPTDVPRVGFDDDGYWVVTRHADVKDVSRRSDAFSSYENTAIVRFHADMERESIELQRFILLNMDPPQHTATRRIVSRGFTPRAIESLRAALTDRAAAHRRGGAGRRVAATSSPTSPASCRCRRSPSSSASRRRTGTRSSSGRTRWSATTTRSTRTSTRRRPRPSMLGYAWQMAEERESARWTTSSPSWSPPRSTARLDQQEFGVLRAAARRRRQRDHPQRDHPRHARVPRPPRPVGAVQAAQRPGRRPTRSSAGRRRSRRSSAPRSTTPQLGGVRHRKGDRVGDVLQLGQPRPRRVRRTPTRSTSCATPTRTSGSAAAARTTASAPTSPGSRST